MATIPLYNGGQVGAVSTGVRVPLVAERAVTNPAGGIGQGLVHLGVMGSQAALQMREADDTTGMVQAESLMRQHYADQQLFQQQNPDQKTWQPAWQKRVGDLQDQLGKIDLSPRKRAVLDRAFPAWATMRESDIAGQALQQSMSRAKTGVSNLAMQMVPLGDDASISKLRPMLPPSMPDEEKDALLLPYQMQAQDARKLNNYNSLLSMAQKDPKNAYDIALAHEKEGNIDKRQSMMIQQAAQSQIQQNRAQSLKTFSNRISIGDIPSKEELEKDSWMTDLDRRMILHQATSIPSNDQEKFQKVMTAIEGYTPRAGDDYERAKFEAAMNSEFSGAFLNQLKERWDAKQKASDFTTSHDLGEAFKTLDRLAFDEQRMGVFKEPEKGPDGKVLKKKKEGLYTWDPDKGISLFGLLDEGAYVQGKETYEDVMKTNPAMLDKVSQSVAAVKETLKREVAEKKLMDQASIFKRMSELVKIPISSKAASEAAGSPGDLPLPQTINPKNGTPVDFNTFLQKYGY